MSDWSEADYMENLEWGEIGGMTEEEQKQRERDIAYGDAIMQRWDRIYREAEENYKPH